MKKILISLFCIFLFTNIVIAADSTTPPCAAGYYNEPTFGCTQCPNDHYCDGTTKFSCNTKTGGTHPSSNEGAKSINDCYKTCKGTLEDGNNANYNNACKCVANAARDASGTCQCNTGYKEQDGKCNAIVKKITLKKNINRNTNSSGEKAQDYDIWFKYGEGFAKTENSTKWENDISTLSVLQPDFAVRKFTGYYTKEDTTYYYDKVFEKTGEFTTYFNIFNPIFLNQDNLYGGWSNKSFTIIYTYKPENSETELSYTTTCAPDTKCTALENLPSTWKITGNVLTKWKCKNEKGNSCGDIAPGAEISEPDNDNELTRTLTPELAPCPKGFYCDANGKHDCPMGSTTDGTGKSKIDDCIMKRGNNGTKFCDEVGCFYLPGTGNIAY